MYENKFQRVEEKYLLTKDQKINLLRKISPMIQKDHFFKSTICNIYFDTKNNDLIINSLEKPLFKEKVRLRSYGIPSNEDEVFLEMKEKYKGTVSKRRIKLTLKDLYHYLQKKQNTLEDQIMKEIDYYFHYCHLEPKIYIAYDRESYQGIEDNSLRITFDSNLRSRQEDLKLELGDAGHKYFEQETHIMEIKTLGAIPLWLVKILSELKIYPVSFSKYGKIYQKITKETEEITC